VADGDRSARRYKRLDPDQQSLAARRVTDLRHVVVGGDYITDRHAPALLKKIGKIKFSGSLPSRGSTRTIRGALPSTAASKTSPLPTGEAIGVRPRSPVSEMRPG
jgi:hypothetical protein